MNILSSLVTFFTKQLLGLQDHKYHLEVEWNHPPIQNEGLSMSRNVILNLLRQESKITQDNIKHAKKAKGLHWVLAEKGTPEGAEAFENYSYFRSLLKKERSKLAKLNAAIRSVKKSNF